WHSAYAEPYGLNLTLPDFTAAYGPCKIIVNFDVKYFLANGALVKQESVNGGNQQMVFMSGGSYSIDFDSAGFYSYPEFYFGWAMEVFVQPGNGSLISVGSINKGVYPISNPSWELRGKIPCSEDERITRDYFLGSPYHNVTVSNLAGSNQLRLSNQTLLNAAQVDLYYRPQGSTGAYSKLPTSVMPGQSGTYVANMAGLNGTYDMMLVSTDKDGKVLRNDKLTVNHTAAGGSVTRTSGVTNSPIIEGGVMHLAGLQLTSNGKLATSLIYTALPSGTPVTINARNGIPGLFDIPVSTGDAQIIAIDANGNRDTLIAQINTATATASLKAVSVADSTLVFRNLSKDATQLTIRYRLAGASTWLTKTLTRPAGSVADWNWDTQADGLVPDRTKAYQYEVQFDAYDSDGSKVNNGTASITAGAIPGGTYTTPTITG
ncbi:hypothetical protein, partial [Herbaspirillum autotrophicum]|uniref:hypothetical protein n=1 Tax=Herbaspirillum autotrophicum TaxID=180195 RepID=UPI000A48E5C2